MYLRPLSRCDEEEILALEPLIFPNETPWSEKEFNDLFNCHYSFVACDADDRIIGYIIAGKEAEHPWYHIYNLGVTPEYRGCGFATDLMNETINAFRKNHSEDVDLGISLQVRKANKDAIKLYNKLGFSDYVNPDHTHIAAIMSDMVLFTQGLKAKTRPVQNLYSLWTPAGSIASHEAASPFHLP